MHYTESTNTQSILSDAKTAASRWRMYPPILLGIALLVGIYLSEQHSYLLFHSLAEGFAVVVAVAIFLLIWNSKTHLSNSYFLLIGIAYLFIGGLDFMHLLAYKGMGIFSPTGDANLATQIWIAARYMEGISLLVAPLFILRKLRAEITLAIYAIVTALLLLSIFTWDIFPLSYVNGTGLTSFKIASEYFISAMLVGAIVLLISKRSYFSKNMFYLITASMALTIASEISFTLYVDVFTAPNLIGHLLKIISFYLICKAIIVTGLSSPFEVLFRKLKDKNEQYQYLRIHSEKLSAIGQLSSGVAHELRNPLAIVNNAVYYLRMKLGQSEDNIKEHLSIMEREIFRASGIIDGLLDFASSRDPRPGSIYIRPIISTVLAEMSPPNNITVVFNESSSLPKVTVDIEQIRRVFVNIISNSIHAMPQEGTLTIRLEPNINFLDIEFEDTGSGISEEHIDKVFEPLFTTRGGVGGTGIGLAICKSIIETNNGTIKARSQSNQGTTIIVSLPLSKGENDAQRK
ncbi:MAG: hypothetical protein HN929_09275 [Chloroflexi bacterium]|jgi:signal transduction histidine kinase|nr:hypothetical protein [Chloroflexota bacterium]MBT7081639.1 hypothetical protein [Chloroflexota bacterium]MBT7290384.1 hypothetical protein [Chloroflexota bacterium]